MTKLFNLQVFARLSCLVCSMDLYLTRGQVVAPPRRSAQLATGLASALIADHSRYNLVKHTKFDTTFFPAAERR